jgi:hypothetical protein
MVRRLRPATRIRFYNPAPPLLSAFSRALVLGLFFVAFAYVLTLLELRGVALVSMLGAFMSLLAASAARR